MSGGPPPRHTVATPTGAVMLETDPAGSVLTLIRWGGRPTETDAHGPLLTEAAAQIDAYFAGRLERFDLPLAPAETEFDDAVRRAMCAIPYGRTRTYGELARTIGTNPRVAGAACGRNPLPILVPCHRVVGADGHLVGFSGGSGVETKRALLAHEGALLL